MKRHKFGLNSVQVGWKVSSLGQVINGRPAKFVRGCSVAALISAACLAMPAGAVAEISLTFGTYAADKPTASIKKIRPVLNALEKAMSVSLGEPVKISTQIATDYEKGIENLVSGKVDFAKFGPASYVHAKRQNKDIKLLAMEAVKGAKVFSGIICVHKDSDIQTLSDLRGRSFAFGNEVSTIGRYLSQQELLKVGIRSVHLKSYKYLGRHDRVGRAVGNGTFDAGALKSSTFKKLKKKNVPIRKIAEFNNVTKPWIAKSGLSGKLAAALKSALLSIDDPKVLKIIKKSGFLESSDTDYDIIRDAMVKSQSF